VTTPRLKFRVIALSKFARYLNTTCQPTALSWPPSWLVQGPPNHHRGGVGEWRAEEGLHAFRSLIEALFMQSTKSKSRMGPILRLINPSCLLETWLSLCLGNVFDNGSATQSRSLMNLASSVLFHYAERVVTGLSPSLWDLIREWATLIVQDNHCDSKHGSLLERAKNNIAVGT
jgi:hypothetical protein